MADSYLINRYSSLSSNYFPIVFLFFEQLKKHSRLSILHAQYHTCKQRRRVGNPFRNRLRSFTFALVNRVCRERNILDVTSQRYITHHSEHTTASRWSLNVRKILVEKIDSRRRYFQDLSRGILWSKIELVTLYFWMKVSHQLFQLQISSNLDKIPIRTYDSNHAEYLSDHCDEETTPVLAFVSASWEIRRRKIMPVELHGCDRLFNLNGYKRFVFIIPRNERRGIFNATTTIIPYGRFRTIYESEKRKKQDSKTVVCSGFFTFDENPYVDLLIVIHFWLSFWLRCFADCRFVSIGDCVKIAGKKIKLWRSRSRRRKRKRIERKTARVTETGWERTRTHLLVRRAERDWGGRQIRGDSTLELPSS